MVGTLRCVESNAKGCAGGVRAELFDGTDAVMLVWLGQRRIPGIESGRTLRVHGRARQAGERRQGDLQPPLRDSEVIAATPRTSEPGAASRRRTRSKAPGHPRADGWRQRPDLLLAAGRGVRAGLHLLRAGARHRRRARRRGSDPGVAADSARVRAAGGLRLHRRRDQRADRLHGRRSPKVTSCSASGRHCSGRSCSRSSVLIRRPIVGYIWGWVDGHDRDWRPRAQARCSHSTSRRSSGCWCSPRASSCSTTSTTPTDRLARRRPYRDGVAADRGGRTGHVSGHPRRPAGVART